MTLTQDTDYSLPPSQVVNYFRDKVPHFGKYYLFETGDQEFTGVIFNVLGQAEIYEFSRQNNFSVYEITSHETDVGEVIVNISNPIYAYSNIDGVLLEDYRTGFLSDYILVFGLVLLFVYTFLGRFKRGKYS